MFEPFFTTKEVGEGTGLGLATVYAIVERHHGFIVVDSAPGRGSTFHLYFPANRVAVPEPPVDQHTIVPTTGSGTLLLAEDDELVRDLAIQVLEGAGYRVLTARDGQEAVELFQAHPHEVDLALLDVVMPRLSGRAVYEHIQRSRPDLPVLFCSGYSYDELENHQLPEGDAELLQKPYRGRALLRRIRRMLGADDPS